MQGIFKAIVGTKKKKVIAEDKDIITSIIKAIEKIKRKVKYESSEAVEQEPPEGHTLSAPPPRLGCLWNTL
ncbi:hypothetical protein BLFGPEAP_01107 [Candidatus Methanoperedenaceae archaeon GB50]|nr:hypothetical protein BLFGPEAP_01107 [Candidatus Methanoperedenaceae archaeon GB50]